MAVTLQIENYDVSTTVDLINLSGVTMLATNLKREISYTGEDGLITRTYTFRVTGSSKANARSNANSLVTLLRQAVNWNEDDLEAESVFLRDAADGETATRLLIKGFEATVYTRLPGADPYQTSSTGIFVKAAFTLQNHREDISETGLTAVSSSGASIGKKYTLSSSAAYTKPSRIQELTFSVGSNPTDKFWIGIQPYTGGDFQPVWELDKGTVQTDTVATGTTTGSYSTNTLITDFATNAGMTLRLKTAIGDHYTTPEDARGKYVALLRYQLPSSNAVIARIGVHNGGQTSYNEARLLTDDGVWHFANMGVVKLPPHGWRQLTTATKVLVMDAVFIFLGAQRLSGSGSLIMDTLTFIPYHSYIHLTDCNAYTGYVQYIITHENFLTESFTGTYTGDDIRQWAVIAEQNNWLSPIPARGASDYLQMVIATETKSSGQVAADSIVNLTRDIVPAWEVYRG